MRAPRRLPLATFLWSLLVAVGAAAGGLIALWSFSRGYRLSVGTISVSVSPFHPGALDVYVPLVDWGVRFPGVTFPARLNVGVQAVDREAAAAIAGGGSTTIDTLRDEATGALTSYLKLLAVIAGGAALALGLLVAAAVRSLRGATPAPASSVAPRTAAADAAPRRGRVVRHRWWAVPVVTVALGWVAAVALLLAPRGELPNPVYYAHGADIPVALATIESVGRSSGRVSLGFEEQIQGLARLVIDPGRRPELSGRPRLTIASDMHNNVLLTPTLERAAAGGPVLFPGDLTDTGSPLEVAAARAVVGTGRPFVFVAGNHDSDTSLDALADEGAIVLTSRGRLLPSGLHGPVTVRVGGLRVAGFGSPNLRRARDGYRDRGTAITPADQQEFATWFAGIADRVDVVLVHEPSLAEPVIERLRAERREQSVDAAAPSILFVFGDTHRPVVEAKDGVLVVNGGTIGAGGTGNLNEGQDASLAIVTYDRGPFTPLAADVVTLDPGTGETVARRVRIDPKTPLQLREPVVPGEN
jgi:predicted phosphodiesterase